MPPGRLPDLETDCRPGTFFCRECGSDQQPLPAAPAPDDSDRPGLAPSTASPEEWRRLMNLALVRPAFTHLKPETASGSPAGRRVLHAPTGPGSGDPAAASRRLDKVAGKPRSGSTGSAPGPNAAIPSAGAAASRIPPMPDAPARAAPAGAPVPASVQGPSDRRIARGCEARTPPPHLKTCLHPCPLGSM